MPYIQKGRRQDLLNFGKIGDPQNIGELNYVLTTIILHYLQDNGTGKRCYEKYNSIMGALSCIQHELYRRMIAPYEDKKIQENGDVYDI
jgi:hypothetical protein